MWPLEHAVRCTEGADFLARGHEPVQGASRKCAIELAKYRASIELTVGT
jgi:hypothetical protein